METFVIDAVVKAVLGPSHLARIADTREHTDVVCTACRGEIPPEDPTPASVVVGVSENRVLRIGFAHAACAASQIYDIDVEVDLTKLTSVSFVAYPILRAPPAFPRAMVVFELAVTVIDEPGGGDRMKQAFIERGWTPVTDTWDRITAARARGLVVRRRDEQLVVEDEVGEIVAFTDKTPPGWWEIAAAEEGCLVLYGSELGLDRIDPERINAALQASACAAATALVEPWAALEPVFDPEEIASLDERHANASSRAAGVHILAEEDEGHQYVTVYERPGRRASHWFRVFGPAVDELEAAIERGAASGAPPAALAAGLEALAAGDRQEADRVVRESIGS